MKIEHLSWSKENAFQRCGQQFAFLYGEQLRRPPGVGLVRGRAPHVALEADLKAKMESGALLERDEVVEIADAEVQRAFRGEVRVDGEYEGLSVKDAKHVVRTEARALAQTFHERTAPIIEPTGIELRIRAEFPEQLPVPYEGIIDVIDRGETVGDFKTSRKAPPKSAAHDSEQLTIYWGLFSAAYGRAPEHLALHQAWVTPAGNKGSGHQPTTRTERDLSIRFARSRRMLEAIEAEIFLPAPVDSWVCSKRWCGFTDVCPYFAGRERPRS